MPSKKTKTTSLEMPADVKAFFVEQGRIGGKKGGKKLAKLLTPEELSARARKAAVARWEKSKGNK